VADPLLVTMLVPADTLQWCGSAAGPVEQSGAVCGIVTLTGGGECALEMCPPCAVFSFTTEDTHTNYINITVLYYPRMSEFSDSTHAEFHAELANVCRIGRHVQN